MKSSGRKRTAVFANQKTTENYTGSEHQYKLKQGKIQRIRSAHLSNREKEFRMPVQQKNHKLTKFVNSNVAPSTGLEVD